jgi:hypothetical protein
MTMRTPRERKAESVVCPDCGVPRQLLLSNHDGNKRNRVCRPCRHRIIAEYHAFVDEMVVESVAMGHKMPTSRGERTEITRVLTERGWPASKIGALLGVTDRSVDRYRYRYRHETPEVTSKVA